MITRTYSKYDNSCLTNARDDEPIFVLRAHDDLAPIVVRIWKLLARQNGVNLAKQADAEKVADAMEAWQGTNGAKLPD